VRAAAAWRQAWRRLLGRLRRALGPDAGARRAIWGLLFVVATAAIFASAALPDQVSLHAGEAAPATIKAVRDFVDEPATEQLRAAAAAAVKPVYRIDDGLMQQALSTFDNAVAALGAARRTANLTDAQRAALLAPQLPPDIPAADAQAVLQADAETLVSATADARAAFLALLQAGVQPDGLDAAKASLAAQMHRLPYAAGVDDFFARLAADALVADDLEDTAATARAQQAAAARVAPVIVVRGQVIVREGDLVTPDDITRLRDAGLLREQGSGGLLLGALLTAALLALLAGSFCRFHLREVLQRERALVLFGAVVLAVLGIERLLLPLSPYLVPAAAGTMLYAVAFGPAAAVFGAALLAAAAGILAQSVGAGVAVLAGALVAAFTAGGLHGRRDLVRAGLYAGGAAALSVLALALLVGGTALSRPQLLANMAFAALSGVLAGVLAVGCLTYVEDLFGILTPVRLLELSNPNQPLLRRLVVEAPGTYHHSLMVANLAEAAAQAVGGNALLLRVGALYHDVGKLKRPYFFVENQFGGDNPHDRLSPNLSALVITSHVKDGVELARAHRLPEEIVDFIRTHHGTQLVSYFYERARQEADAGDLMEVNFRYDGPLPGTREQAILMLADGVEAAVRAARQPAPDQIEASVRRLLRDRLESGQLDKAALTLQDLDGIGAAFCRILQGIYHARVQYPEQVMQEWKGTGGQRELRRGAGA
jgi:putative nucleotidyltransferase with HDIG domain